MSKVRIANNRFQIEIETNLEDSAFKNKPIYKQIFLKNSIAIKIRYPLKLLQAANSIDNKKTR